MTDEYPTFDAEDFRPADQAFVSEIDAFELAAAAAKNAGGGYVKFRRGSPRTGWETVTMLVLPDDAPA